MHNTHPHKPSKKFLEKIRNLSRAARGPFFKSLEERNLFGMKQIRSRGHVTAPPLAVGNTHIAHLTEQHRSQYPVARDSSRGYYFDMSKASWRSRLVEYITDQAKPVDKFSHQARLYRLAISLAANRRFDDDVVFAAAWIHDLGVFIGHRPADPKALSRWDHLAYVVDKAPTLLEEVGFPFPKVPAVLEAIRTHMPNSAPTTFEGQLLRDADILEQLGAVGILRTVSKVGRDTRFALFSDALNVLQRNARELPSKLQLDSSQDEVKARFTMLKSFLAAAESEAAGIEW